MIDGIREALNSLESRIDQRLQNFEVRLQGFEARMQGFEARVDQRFLALESQTTRRFDSLDAKMTSYFTWLIGLYVTGLIAVIAALIAR